jgi:hypothetical protein
MNHEPKNAKQTQFSKGKNAHKPSFNKELRNVKPGSPVQNETNFTRR